MPCQVFQRAESYLSPISVRGQKGGKDVCPISKPEPLSHFKTLSTSTVFQDPNAFQLLCMSKNGTYLIKAIKISCVQKEEVCLPAAYQHAKS